MIRTELTFSFIGGIRMFIKGGSKLDSDYALALRDLELEREKEPKARRLTPVAESLFAIGKRAIAAGRRRLQRDALAQSGDLFAELEDPRAADAFEAASLVQRALELVDPIEDPQRSTVDILISDGRFEDAARRCLEVGDVRRAMEVFKIGGLVEDVAALLLFYYSDIDAAVKLCLAQRRKMGRKAYDDVISVSQPFEEERRLIARSSLILILDLVSPLACEEGLSRRR